MSRRSLVFLLVALALIAAGAVAGLFVGRAIADSNADRDRRAADSAAVQEDDARDRRDLLDARLRYIETQTKALPKVAAAPPLLAAASSTADVEPGTSFSVDGGDYVVRRFEIVDGFDSRDPKRPATERDGHRWGLVHLDYVNRTKDYVSPACGTLRTVHVVLDDRTTIGEVDSSDEKPPVHEDTYDVCGMPLAPGARGRYVAPLRLPREAAIAGILVGDTYVRTTGSEFNVRAGKMAWMPFDEPIEVDGDDVDERYVEEDE